MGETVKTVIFLIIRLTVLIMGIMLCVYASQAKSEGEVNLNPVVQVTEDWKLLPFVDIKVKTVACDPATERDIFTYTWPGTSSGSICGGKLSTASAKSGSKLRPGCRGVSGILAKSTSTFDGKYLCGKLGGVPFEKVKRVEASGSCPTGTSACPGNAAKTPENTLCYPTAKLGECPITDVKFLKGGKAGNEYSKKVKFVNGYSVTYTKTAVDGLPVTQFKVGEAPCAISTAFQATKDDAHYELEREKNAKCPKSKLTDQILDARFSQLNMKYNLGDLHREAGVFKLLGEKKQNNIPAVMAARDKIDTSFWQRPNMGWSLRCERMPETNRAAYLKVLDKISLITNKNAVGQDQGVLSYNLQLAYTCALVATICAGLLCLPAAYVIHKGISETGKFWFSLAVGCGILWPLSFLIGVIVSSYKGQGDQSAKAAIMTEMGAFKGCGGPQLEILESATAGMVNSAYILSGMIIAGWVMFGLVLCNCCCTAGMAFVKA